MRLHLMTALGAVSSISHVLMSWKALCLVTQTSHPVHVIVSDSMEPSLQRGDIIIISNRDPVIHVGDIPVVWFEDALLPMTHRVTEVFWERTKDGKSHEQLIMTKGDNNEVNDLALYPGSQEYVYRHQIIGVVKGYVPWLGWITIWLDSLQYMKYLLIAALVLIAMLWSQ